MSGFALRMQVEDFLYAEAELLDEWRLAEWLTLFTEDAVYQVPATDLDDDAQPDDNLFYIADDHARLKERVIRLEKRGAHAEQPRSKTRHLVTNIRVSELPDGDVAARAAFVVYRAKGGLLDAFVGHSRYTLSPDGPSFRIRAKRCALDMDGLKPQGRISILL
jgi:p-cumate 2,3-dioxygenase beta subunit